MWGDRQINVSCLPWRWDAENGVWVGCPHCSKVGEDKVCDEMGPGKERKVCPPRNFMEMVSPEDCRLRQEYIRGCDID